MTPSRICASSFARAFAELAADRWGFLVLLGAFNGNRRFQDWERSAGFTPGVLSNRLRHMVAVGILRQRPIDHSRERLEYLLTDKGLGLQAWALAVWRWERDWHNPPDATEDGRFTVLVHRNCGAEMSPRFVCDCCAAVLEPQAVTWLPGPGLEERNYLAGLTSRRSEGTATAAAPKFSGGAFDLIGDRWTLALMVAFFQGVCRYEALRSELGLATNILALRLKRMAQDGLILRQRVAQESDRFEYRLTDKGLALYPIFLGLTLWADRWLSGARGIPFRMHHGLCHSDCRTEVRCDACAQPLSPRDVKARVMTGADLAAWRERMRDRKAAETAD